MAQNKKIDSNKSDSEKLPPFHGGDALLNAIQKEGCDYVFGIPGGEFIQFLEAVDRREKSHNDIHYLGVRHEQAAANMADAYSRVSGKVGVCCGTLGPGFADLLPGVSPAYFDNIPMLVIHPQADNKFDDHHRLQQGMDQMAVMKPVVKYQKSISNPNRIIWGAQKCFKALKNGRPGPVQLEIREDAFSGQIEDYGRVALEPSRYRCVDPPMGNINAIKRACDLLAKSEKPVLVVGGGVILANAHDSLRKLSLGYNIPVITTVMGIGTISSNQPTFVGTTLSNGASLSAARNADCVIAIGTKFSYTLAYGKSPIWNAEAKLIQIDIDPQMIGKNRPVDVGILGDCGVIINQFIEELKNREFNAFSEDWNNSIQEQRKMAIDMDRRKMHSDKTPIHPLRLINDILEFANPEDIICTDGGDITTMLTTHIDFVKHRDPRTYLTSIGFGHLGVGIPYAIGAKLAKPDVRVFCVSGDGSVMFNIQELLTAVSYKIPFVCIVADNCAWGMIKNNEKRNFRKRPSFCVDFEDTDYAKIAEGFGCYSERIQTPDQIKPALQRAVESNKPALIQVPVKFVSPEGSKMMKMFRQLKF